MDTSGTIVDSLGMCLTMESTNDPTHRLQLRAASPTIGGEPSRIAMCHCLECQRRTGVVISNQARFRLEEVSFAGKTTAWTRTAESGNVMPYHFCPICACHWQLCRPYLPRTDRRSLGRDYAPVGLFAARHASQARPKAGIDSLKWRAGYRQSGLPGHLDSRYSTVKVADVHGSTCLML
jgi:Glutathione-dependent formaldehyde-activating enzyme